MLAQFQRDWTVLRALWGGISDDDMALGLHQIVINAASVALPPESDEGDTRSSAAAPTTGSSGAGGLYSLQTTAVRRKWEESLHKLAVQPVSGASEGLTSRLRSLQAKYSTEADSMDAGDNQGLFSATDT